MNNIFKDLIASGAVTIYLNDILIMSKTKEEHRCIAHEVLKVLWKNKLFLKVEKCKFENTGNRIPWSHHQWGQHSHGSGQNTRNSIMAHTSQETTITIVLRLYELLSVIHKRIQQGHQTYDSADGGMIHGSGGRCNKTNQLKRQLAEGHGVSNTNRGRQVLRESGC